MNYYNEFDPKAAAWLRELIRAQLIPNGTVDERSITDVQPDELRQYRQCHFFAGIGGWSWALRLARWPEDRPVWTGSCPCQPFSAAGKQRGTADERHLWPAFARLIRECRPTTVFGEQVASKLGREWLSGVFADLEGMGYAVAGADLCAAGVGAPHIRQRLYWVAHTAIDRWREGSRQSGEIESEGRWEFESPEHGGLVGLAHTSSPGSGRNPGTISSPEGEGCCERAHARGVADELVDGGAAYGLAHPEGGNGRLPVFAGRQDEACAEFIRGREACTERLGDTSSAGLEEQRGEPGASRCAGCPDAGQAVERASSSSGFWDHYTLLPCTDGKQRRTQPGIQPLAHGVSGRVAQLRGLGNAIVPPLAAEFIKAFTPFSRIAH